LLASAPWATPWQRQERRTCPRHACKHGAIRTARAAGAAGGGARRRSQETRERSNFKSERYPTSKARNPDSTKPKPNRTVPTPRKPKARPPIRRREHNRKRVASLLFQLGDPPKARRAEPTPNRIRDTRNRPKPHLHPPLEDPRNRKIKLATHSKPKSGPQTRPKPGQTASRAPKNHPPRPEREATRAQGPGRQGRQLETAKHTGCLCKRALTTVRVPNVCSGVGV
jgi:hypothetical protein